MLAKVVHARNMTGRSGFGLFVWMERACVRAAEPALGVVAVVPAQRRCRPSTRRFTLYALTLTSLDSSGVRIAFMLCAVSLVR